MRRLLIASAAALALSATSAFAADLGIPYYKSPPPPPPPVSWTGCYIDGGFGYGMWNQDHYTENSVTRVPITGTDTDGGRGWLGRFGGGCDYQVSPRIVVGVLGDYDWMSLTGISHQDLTATPTPFFGINGTERETSSWSVGARIGYLVTPSLLTYFDGGYTQARFGQVSYVNDTTTLGIGTATGLSMPATTYHGWFIGGGTEYALDMDWIPIRGLFWRNEYRYASYSGTNIADVCVGGGATCGAAGTYAYGEHASKDVQTITSSLVWRFNWGGPLGGLRE